MVVSYRLDYFATRRCLSSSVTNFRPFILTLYIISSVLHLRCIKSSFLSLLCLTQKCPLKAYSDLYAFFIFIIDTFFWDSNYISASWYQQPDFDTKIPAASIKLFLSEMFFFCSAVFQNFFHIFQSLVQFQVINLWSLYIMSLSFSSSLAYILS